MEQGLSPFEQADRIVRELGTNLALASNLEALVKKRDAIGLSREERVCIDVQIQLIAELMMTMEIPTA